MSAENNLILKDYLISETKFKNLRVPLNSPLTIEGVMFVFCIKGELIIKKDSSEILITANTIFTMLPYHIIEICDISMDLEIEYQFFSMDYILGFFLIPGMAYL